MQEIRPDYYKSGGMEAREVIKAYDLNFNLGNAFKYISRAGKKGHEDKKIEDLKKAITYLNFEIEDIKEANKKKLIEEKIRLSPILESKQSEMDKMKVRWIKGGKEPEFKITVNNSESKSDYEAGRQENL